MKAALRARPRTIRRLVESVHLYPVKSLGGVAVRRAEVEPWGLAGDRRWVVLDPDGAVRTARRQHSLLDLTAAPLADGAVALTGVDGSTLRVEAPVDGERIPAAVSRLESVRSAGAEADAWLSHQLGLPVRLAWLDDPRRRTVSAAHGGRPGDSLSLADAGPLLLATRASLRRLDDWVAAGAAERGEAPPAPLAMARFRPNVVVDLPCEPFAEDGWTRVRIGAVELRVAECCDRCVMTTIDPATLAGGKEPLRTLARHRRRHGRTWFGVRLVPLGAGAVCVGDAVVPASSSQ